MRSRLNLFFIILFLFMGKFAHSTQNDSGTVTTSPSILDGACEILMDSECTSISVKVDGGQEGHADPQG